LTSEAAEGYIASDRSRSSTLNGTRLANSSQVSFERETVSESRVAASQKSRAASGGQESIERQRLR
jgi:hypothetical protein